MLVIAMVSLYSARGALESVRIAQLEVVADLKVSKITAFVNERMANIQGVQGYFNIKTNLPILNRLANDRRHPDYIAAKKMLDSQLKSFQQAYGFVYVDVMLVNPEGKIIYVTNVLHEKEDLGHYLHDLEDKAFEEGRKGIYFSKIFYNAVAKIPFSMLVTAPVLDFQERFIGVIVLEVDMNSIYKIIQDTTGLGNTGETFIGKKVDEVALFLSPLRHDEDAGLKRTVMIGNADGIPLQEAVEGREGAGILLDYRGEKVIAAWRYIPLLDWGLVAKIDTNEAFSSIHVLRYYVFFVAGMLVLILGFISTSFAKSISAPLNMLQKGVSRVIHGDLNHNVVIDTHDEIGTLAVYFNTMLFTLKERNKDLRDFKYVLDETSIVSLVDRKGTIEYVNDRFCRISGYDRSEIIGGTHRIIKSGIHPKAFYKEMWTTIGKGNVWRGIVKNKAKDGSFYWADTTIVPFLDDQGKPYQFLSSQTDITQRKIIEDKIRLLAHYDELTSLPNRTLFNERLEQMLKRRYRGKRSFAIMFLDLDRFKLVNDTLGHSAGDDLLQQVAGRLTDCLRKGDTVARMGGDEFTILLTDIAKGEDVFLVGQKIVDVFEKPFVIENQELIITGSIGISIYPENGEDAETLLKNADAAMYSAKENGRGRFNFYISDMNTQTTNKLKMISDLSHAIDREELRLHYQPIVDLKNEKIIGMEALIRWQREEGVMVSPAEFIPLAEECGLIVRIGDWVLRTASLQLKSWQDAGYCDLTLSVNVAALQFQESDFVEGLSRVITETRIDPKRLKLELTETLLMKNHENVNLRLNAIKALGVLLAIDDFGTGYSSLSYLKSFPVDTLKIDRSFVSHLPENPDDAAISKMIISLARQLRLDVVAEGIETKEQLAFLRSHGCQMGQGYLFSRPIPAEEFTALLNRMFAGNFLNPESFEDLKMRT